MGTTFVSVNFIKVKYKSSSFDEFGPNLDVLML